LANILQTSFATAMAVWEFCQLHFVVRFLHCFAVRISLVFGSPAGASPLGFGFWFSVGHFGHGIWTRLPRLNPNPCQSVHLYVGATCAVSPLPANFITIMSAFVRALLIRLLPAFPLKRGPLCVLCLLNESWCCFLKFRNHFDHLSPANCLQLDAFNKKETRAELSTKMLLPSLCCSGIASNYLMVL